MSPDLAVSVASVTKRFATFRSTADQIVEYLSFGRAKRRREHWALRDVSFDVGKGECIGILGTNGSGKSTLLQIVAGTMRPSEGSVSVRGRVAALLELGAGFAPDFTGRENALLNARLLGCTAEEAEANLPQVLEFADIGDFIDRPVRTYSSGMYVRLAFAMAAAASPDVFIIDEALAVGDRVFQGRCYARLRALRDRGTTILFVSHDLASIRSFCDRAVWIEKGVLRAAGPVAGVVDDYLAGTTSTAPAGAKSAPARPGSLVLANGSSLDISSTGSGSGELRLTQATLRLTETDADGQLAELVLEARAEQDVLNPDLSLRIDDIRGAPLYGTGMLSEGRSVGPVHRGDVVEAVFRLPLPLKGDIYPVSFAASDGCHTGPHLPLDAIESGIFIDTGSRGGRHLISIRPQVEARVSRARTDGGGRDARPLAAA